MASLPTIEVVGPAGRRIVNESNLDFWRKKGYRPIGEEPAPSDSDHDYDFAACKVPQLKEFASEAGIEGFDTMNKAELVEALIDSGYRPSNEE